MGAGFAQGKPMKNHPLSGIKSEVAAATRAGNNWHDMVLGTGVVLSSDSTPSTR